MCIEYRIEAHLKLFLVFVFRVLTAFQTSQALLNAFFRATVFQ